MLRRLAIIALAAILVAASPIPRTPSQPVPTKPSQQTTAQQNRGTESEPLVVKVLNPKKSQEELDAEKAKESTAAAREQRIADATNDLAGYTFGLYRATLILALITGGLVALGTFQLFDNKRSIKAAEQSARAAAATVKLTRDMFIAENRPILKVKFVADKSLTWSGRKARMNLEVTFKNLGKGDARVLIGDFRIVAATGLPPFQNLETVQNEVIGVGHVFTLSGTMAMKIISPGETEKIFQEIEFDAPDNTNWVAPTFLGAYRYLSDDKRLYQAAFCWRIARVDETSQEKNVVAKLDIGRDIPLDGLVVIPHLFGNFDRQVADEDVRGEDGKPFYGLPPT